MTLYPISLPLTPVVRIEAPRPGAAIAPLPGPERPTGPPPTFDANILERAVREQRDGPDVAEATRTVGWQDASRVGLTPVLDRLR